MKTSVPQYDILVTYMEQHGDLSKPTGNPCGRAQALKRWQELVAILNSESTGDAKPLDKWKKVWSDFKSYTKKKASKLHRAASATGGGPAVHAKLSDLESRVLAVIGPQAATGLNGVDEAGFYQTPRVQEDPLPAPEPVLIVPEANVFVEEAVEDIQAIEDLIRHEPTPQASVVEEMNESTPRQSAQSHAVPQVPQVPSPSGHTPRRRTGRRLRDGPRRHIDEASSIFISSDEQWRLLKQQQHRDWMQLKREQLRVRELEVQAQNGWQALFREGLELFKQYINK